MDEEDFVLCDETNIKQYYVRRSTDSPPEYNGEKRGMEKKILTSYQFPETRSENGYLTICFIVNCKGESGRFRTVIKSQNHLKTSSPLVT